MRLKPLPVRGHWMEYRLLNVYAHYFFEHWNSNAVLMDGIYSIVWSQEDLPSNAPNSYFLN